MELVITFNTLSVVVFYLCYLLVKEIARFYKQFKYGGNRSVDILEIEKQRFTFFQDLSMRYCLDMFLFSKIFYRLLSDLCQNMYFTTITKIYPEEYISLWCAGLVPEVDDEEINLKEIPTAKKLRQFEYFDFINFKKLLLKEYNLETELELNLPKMFQTYLDVSNSTKKLSHSNLTRNMFKRNENEDYLKHLHGPYSRLFIDLEKQQQQQQDL